MLNKKEIEKLGFSFIKVNGNEFLDMSNPVGKKVERCPMVEAEVAMRNHFLETSQERGKALSILLPLFDQEKMTDLLSELYDLRAESSMRKAEDKMAEQEVAGVMEALGNIFGNHHVVKKLNSIIEPKCHQKKNRPKKAQEKKAQKKKK